MGNIIRREYARSGGWPAGEIDVGSTALALIGQRIGEDEAGRPPTEEMHLKSILDASWFDNVGAGRILTSQPSRLSLEPATLALCRRPSSDRVRLFTRPVHDDIN